MPELNLFLNALSIVSVSLGLGALTQKISLRYQPPWLLQLALFSSLAFLATSLFIYFFQVDAMSFLYDISKRQMYYAIFLPHVFFAFTVIPLILVAVWIAEGSTRRMRKYRTIMTWIVPVWAFVSMSGGLLYFNFYRNS